MPASSSGPWAYTGSFASGWSLLIFVVMGQ
jgi:hypothetical protein